MKQKTKTQLNIYIHIYVEYHTVYINLGFIYRNLFELIRRWKHNPWWTQLFPFTKGVKPIGIDNQVVEYRTGFIMNKPYHFPAGRHLTQNHALLKPVLCACNRNTTETYVDQRRWALGLAPGQLLVLHAWFAQPKDTHDYRTWTRLSHHKEST